MNKTLKFISEIFIFLGFLCLVFDIRYYNMTKELFKDSLDLSTKAAVLQIDKDSLKIAQGIFEIEENEAKIAFINMMSLNLKVDKSIVERCMIDYKAINNVENYLNPADNKIYYFDKPTFVATMKFKYNGLLLKKEIVLSNNFAASQLIQR